jgi:hypothetical protein
MGSGGMMLTQNVIKIGQYVQNFVLEAETNSDFSHMRILWHHKRLSSYIKSFCLAAFFHAESDE